MMSTSDKKKIVIAIAVGLNFVIGIGIGVYLYDVTNESNLNQSDRTSFGRFHI
ncbi:hypothetical protein IQ247_20035 [Plectonema cf. radiosum LEGE 06105]|uniref:Uncharacterized protein n=1 Tax=Plectonema cf. radiosum LEGE 06105 TaxID=945769 RepID=A0A8J7JUE1_9CYAN|nr:hypothetical protein [Plectonema radiosum]MBE9214934.1 hypothetical protein [Plectonema cf. radiosum LEGE 06105]